MIHCIRCHAKMRIDSTAATIPLPGDGLRYPDGALQIQGAYYCQECGPHVEICAECGCTDECGCPEGCSWVAPGLCSSCASPGEASDAPTSFEKSVLQQMGLFDDEPQSPSARCYPGQRDRLGAFRR